MAQYRDAVSGLVDTTGASSPKTNAAVNPVVDVSSAPNGNSTGTPVSLNVSIGGGMNYLAALSNPA